MTGTRRGRIFHLMPGAHWEREPVGGPLALGQYERDGLVHCCTREQILEIAEWWLAEDAPLVALELDEANAGDVRFEPADLGRAYPHVYNPIPHRALLAVHDLPAAGGSITLPPQLAEPPPEFAVEGTRRGRTVNATWRGGDFAGGDAALIADARDAVAKGLEVPQFPGVTRLASVETAYDAFCVIVSLLDEVTAYHGDGYTRGPDE